MSYTPGQPAFTTPGATNNRITASGWIIDPASNSAGIDVTSVSLSVGPSGLAYVRYGNNTGTPTSNPQIIDGVEGSNAIMQNIFLPTGYGLYLDKTNGFSAYANAWYNVG